ncbi:MAG: Bro-N domain-containing protein [Victivallaceae bacterium]
MDQNKLVVFQSKNIRRVWHKDEWYYSVVDICGALTDSNNPRDYWYRVKKRVSDEEQIELSTICRQLKLSSSDGKKYTTDCSNVEGIFRIIQSIPSPKAEPDTFNKNKAVAKRGGRVAGNARKETEKELGRTVVSKNNYLNKKDDSKLDK